MSVQRPIWIYVNSLVGTYCRLSCHCPLRRFISKILTTAHIFRLINHAIWKQWEYYCFSLNRCVCVLQQRSMTISVIDWIEVYVYTVHDIHKLHRYMIYGHTNLVTRPRWGAVVREHHREGSYVDPPEKNVCINIVLCENGIRSDGPRV